MLGVAGNPFDEPVFSGFNIQFGTHGFGGLQVGYHAFFLHAVQGINLALPGQFRMVKGAVPAGCLGQACQHGTFSQGQVLDMLSEIVFRSRFNTVSAVSQVDLVQIQVEYFIFGKLFFNFIGENRFFKLALISFFRSKKKRFGHLLGDGGATLDNGASLKIFYKRPDNGFYINAGMFPEPGIFGCYKRIDQISRHVGQGNDDSAFFVKLADFSAVVGEYIGHNGRTVIIERVDMGKFLAKIKKSGGNGCTSGNNCKDEQDEHPHEKREPYAFFFFFASFLQNLGATLLFCHKVSK